MASRALQGGARRAAPDADDEFPELEATFQAAPTRLSPETATVEQPTELRLPATALAPQPRHTPWRAVAAAGAILVVAAAAALMLRGTGSQSRPAAASGEVRVPVRSKPPGAAVLIDGQETGVTTDGELALPASRRGQALLTFRQAGYRDETRTVSLPLPAGEAVSVTLGLAPSLVRVVSDPPGATLALDGRKLDGVTPLDVSIDPALEHRFVLSMDAQKTQELRIPAGKLSKDVRVTMEPAGPLGAVIVSSSYPLDVMWKGRLLAKGQSSPRVSLPEGKQSLTLVSNALFLRATVSVDVKGESSIQAPAVGRINIKANPDTCEVFIDGVSAGYPPILDKSVAAGNHVVLFKWPDGSRHQEAADVPPGRPAYVMGRKD
jgi:hypothetical protein